MKEQKIVFFLGAGASNSDGSLLQNELLNYYFTKLSPFYLGESHSQKFNDFFDEHFNREEPLPTLEEIFGLIYFFQKIKLTNNPEKYQELDGTVALILARMLEYKLKSVRGTSHEILLKKLDSLNLIKKTSFISTNYDILVDNKMRNEHYSIDYGIPIVKDTDMKEGERGRLKLIKLHGSLNWAKCSKCSSVKVFPDKVLSSVEFLRDPCQRKEPCKGSYNKIFLIPPTYFKEFKAHKLKTLIRSSINVLTNTTHIFFCGYSFPDMDMHVKYLLKQSMINSKNIPEIMIINIPNDKIKGIRNDKLKLPEHANFIDEANRYRRFFKDTKKVHYKNLSFEMLPVYLKEIIINENVSFKDLSIREEELITH
ncbi:MAG: SIR2 family protein [Promethearchaeota archaeon]